MSHFLAALHPDDLPIHCQGEPIVDEPEPDEPVDENAEPRDEVDTGRFEDSASYRDGLIDAGRGHLVRHL